MWKFYQKGDVEKTGSGEIFFNNLRRYTRQVPYRTNHSDHQIRIPERKRLTFEERFLEFVNCSKKTGKDLAELYLSRLKEHSISIEDLRGQGYDNASNMSGAYKGVQAEILKQNKFAVYCPCASHSLNLCGVHAVRCTQQAERFFKNIQRLYVLFSSSPSRWEIVKQELRITFKSQSETRWSERIDALKPVAQQIPSVIRCLDRLVEEHKSLLPDAKRSAKQLKN